MRWATLAGRAGQEADAVAAGPRTPGRRPVPPALQGLIAFAIYLVVFVLAFGQALFSHLKDPVVGQVEVDPNFYIWAWRWWAYSVAHWTNPLYSYQIYAPKGVNLAWATTSPTVALLMWPVTYFYGAVVSFNVTLLLAPVASAWAAFVAARRLTLRFWASLPAGVVYGFNVYMLDHEVSGQPNLTVTVLLPLMVWLVVLWWDRTLTTARYVLWMALAIALEFYTFVEAYAEMSLIWAFGLLLGLALAGRGNRRKVVRLAGLTAGSYLIALVLAYPYLRYALKHYPTTLTRPQPHFSMDLVGLVIPRSDRLLGLHFWAPSAGHDITPSTYLGIPLLVTMVLLMLIRWRSRVVWLLFLGFIVILLLCSGPRLIIDGRLELTWPWSGLWGLPIFKSAEPVRFIVFAYLVLSIALAWWLAAVTRSWLVRALRWLLGVLSIAALLADLPTFAEVVVPPRPVGWVQARPDLGLPNQIPAFFADGTYKRYLSPGEIVVVVSRRGNAGMLFQASTGFYFRIDGGFINASLSSVDAIPGQVASMSYPTPLREAAFENYVRTSGIGAIIVEQSWSASWMYNYGRVGMVPVSVGGVTLYQTATMKPVGGQRIPLFPGILP